MDPRKNPGRANSRRNAVNRRNSPRYPVSSAAEAVDIKGDRRIAGRLSDISRSGCYMDTINPFEVEDLLELTIMEDKQSITTQAKVAYSLNGMGMGLSFTTAEPEQLRLLGSWLDDLDGGKERAPNSPDVEMQIDSAKTPEPVLRDIIADLIVGLSRKDILNDPEVNALLRKLSK
jgi:hypothetical protein